MTTDADAALVVDTGPLSHLAKAGWLSVLRSIAGTRTIVIPDAVEAELRQGLGSNTHLQQVLDADWIGRYTLVTTEELAALAGFSARLVAGLRNVGEAAVLAYASTHGAVAVIDDGAGRRAGADAGVTVRPTLALLAEGIRIGHLTVSMVSDLADHLIETKYRLPFARGDFATWAEANGLLPPT